MVLVETWEWNRAQSVFTWALDGMRKCIIVPSILNIDTRCDCMISFRCHRGNAGIHWAEGCLGPRHPDSGYNCREYGTDVFKCFIEQHCQLWWLYTVSDSLMYECRGLVETEIFREQFVAVPHCQPEVHMCQPCPWHDPYCYIILNFLKVKFLE